MSTLRDTLHKALPSLIAAFLGGLVGAAAVLFLLTPECADAALRVMLATGARG